MNSKSLLTAVALLSACAASAPAADLDGSLSLGGSYANVRGQSAKANEYRTIGNGAYGGIDLSYRVPSNFLDVDANFRFNEGKSATDNNFLIKGGRSDAYYLSLYYNEIPHNLAYNARTVFSGVGTSALSTTLLKTSNAATVAATPFNNTFDYALNRTNYGAEAEISLKTPFFFLARVDRTETRGLDVSSYVAGSQTGTWRQVREIPVLVDYTSDNVYLQTGYRSKSLTAAVDGTISQFYNPNSLFTVQQGTFGAANQPSAGYMPADNKFYKLGGSVMYRMPFWTTTLMANGSHSISQSEPIIAGWQSDARYKATQTLLNTRWDGYVVYDAVSTSITSNPTKNLDLRLFYRYFSRQNKSSDNLATNIDPGAGVNSTPAKHSYQKNNAGIDLGYKLPVSTKVSVGYDFTDTKRSSAWTDSLNITNGNPEALKTTDHTMYVQIKNNRLDLVSGKIRYEHQIRESAYPDLALYAAAASTRLYRRGAEGADKTMDAIKAEIEIEPMHGLSFGLQYALKKNDYERTAVGLKDDTRHELYGDTTIAAGIVKLNIFGELEMVENNFVTGQGTPWTVINATNYYWTMQRNDLNYAFGSNVEVDIIKNKLKGTVNYRYEKTEGNTDFTYPVGIINTIGDVGSVDNYIKNTVNTKLTYNFTKNVSLDLGYLFENLKYKDEQYAGYTLVPRGTAYALTGAFANPNFSVNSVYTKLTATF